MITSESQRRARLPSAFRSLAALILLLGVVVSATSCISSRRTFSVSGRVIDGATGQPLSSVRVTLLRVAGTGLFVLPPIEPVAEVVTDQTGSFMFSVKCERGFLIEVMSSESSRPQSHSVPIEEIAEGKLRVEIRFVETKSEVRWNDGDWIRWEKKESNRTERQPNQALQTTPMTRSVCEKTIEFGRRWRGV